MVSGGPAHSSSDAAAMASPLVAHSAPATCSPSFSRVSTSSFHPSPRRRKRRSLHVCGARLDSLPLGTTATVVTSAKVSPFFSALAGNPTFVSGAVAWVSAQAVKFVLNFFVERRWDFRMLVGSGGMPSSHSALCTAMTTSVAICHGVGDALFSVCLGFSLIVMYDATGVRRHAGLQAAVLNMIIQDLFQGHPISQRKLKELLGHTPSQVFAGALLELQPGHLPAFKQRRG